MSDYHILQGDQNANGFVVVFHIPFPAVSNAIGYPNQTALAEFRGAPFASQVPYGLGEEQAQLDGGELIEHAIRYSSNPALTPVQNRDILRQIWTELQQDGGSYQESERNLVTETQNQLKYWHYADNVP